MFRGVPQKPEQASGAWTISGTENEKMAVLRRKRMSWTWVGTNFATVTFKRFRVGTNNNIRTSVTATCSHKA